MNEAPSRRKLAVLCGCDIYRDGGSYSAVFTTTGGEAYKLWLEVFPSALLGSDTNPRHRGLFEGWGDYDRPAEELRRGFPILTGSAEERDIIHQLEAFLSNPTVDVPFAHRCNKEHYLSTLRAMTAAITRRAPCFPGDVKTRNTS
jgi:hypothetical protein